MAKSVKTILITGASSGFGAAAAKLLVREEPGTKLILLARRGAKLAELARELEATGSKIFQAVVDVTERAAVEKFLAGLPQEFSQIDVLVNNAGLARGLDSAETADLSDWEEMVATNINGLLYLTRLVLPGMRERNSGHIVNIGSVAGHAPYKGGNVYGASKAFVAQFSRNLRADLHGSAIRVTNIEPGMAETEFSEVRFKGDAAKAKAVYAGMLPLTPEDIAETISWVLSRPAHVNIDNVEIMPLAQTWGGLVVDRSS